MTRISTNKLDFMSRQVASNLCYFATDKKSLVRDLDGAYSKRIYMLSNFIIL